MTEEQPYKKKIEIDEETGCWNWLAEVDNIGIPTYLHAGQLFKAADYIFQCEGFGKFPAGQMVIPTCGNVKCVNPKHMKFGLWAEYQSLLSDQLNEPLKGDTSKAVLPDEPYSPVNTKRRKPIIVDDPEVPELEPVTLIEVKDEEEPDLDGGLFEQVVNEPVDEELTQLIVDDIVSEEVEPTEEEIQEAFALLGKGKDTYIATDPKGVDHETLDIETFCKENNLKSRFMIGVADGDYKQHKGWTCKVIPAEEVGEESEE